MICNGILDDAKKLQLVDGGADLELEEQAGHHRFKQAHRARNMEAWVDHDEDAVGGSNEDLEAAATVERGIHEVEEALMDDIGTPLSGVCFVLGVVDAMLFAEKAECTVS